MKNIFKKEGKHFVITLALVFLLGFLIFSWLQTPLLADSASCQSEGCSCSCWGGGCTCHAANGSCECSCVTGEIDVCEKDLGIKQPKL